MGVGHGCLTVAGRALASNFADQAFAQGALAAVANLGALLGKSTAAPLAVASGAVATPLAAAVGVQALSLVAAATWRSRPARPRRNAGGPCPFLQKERFWLVAAAHSLVFAALKTFENFSSAVLAARRRGESVFAENFDGIFAPAPRRCRCRDQSHVASAPSPRPAPRTIRVAAAAEPRPVPRTILPWSRVRRLDAAQVTRFGYDAPRAGAVAAVVPLAACVLAPLGGLAADRAASERRQDLCVLAPLVLVRFRGVEDFQTAARSFPGREWAAISRPWRRRDLPAAAAPRSPGRGGAAIPRAVATPRSPNLGGAAISRPRRRRDLPAAAALRSLATPRSPNRGGANIH